MVVLLEKDTIPPPPYFASEHAHLPFSPSPSSLGFSNSYSHNGSSASTSQGQCPGEIERRRSWRPAPPLPSHVLLLITYHTLPTPTDTIPIRQSCIDLDGNSALKVIGRRKMDAREFAVRTTRVLYWMGFCLRGVCRGFYLASMHILRSTFLPHYLQYIRPPYTSDPFPHTSTPPHLTSPSSSHSHLHHHSQPDSGLTSGAVVPISASQPESEVLDRFILFQLHEDVFSDDSSLHLTARPDTLRDLFDFMQPRARLAELIRMYGANAGILTTGLEHEHGFEPKHEEEPEDEDEGVGEGEEDWAWVELSNECEYDEDEELRMIDFLRLTHSDPQTSQLGKTTSPMSKASASSVSTKRARRRSGRQRQIQIPARELRVTFSSRNVGLVYVPSGRTIVHVPREKDESLERSASALVRGLKAWLATKTI